MGTGGRRVGEKRLWEEVASDDWHDSARCNRVGGGKGLCCNSSIFGQWSDCADVPQLPAFHTAAEMNLDLREDLGPIESLRPYNASPAAAAPPRLASAALLAGDTGEQGDTALRACTTLRAMATRRVSWISWCQEPRSMS